MSVYLLTAILFALFMLALGVGVLAGRGPIRGSCGGTRPGNCGLCGSGRCRRREQPR